METSSGPLLWHFENNSSNDPSIELDLEEVKELARTIGFEIKVCCVVLWTQFGIGMPLLQNERTISTTYVNNQDSLLGYVYHAAFWTATKKM